MNFQLLAFCLLAVAYRAEAQCTVETIANGDPSTTVGQTVANAATLTVTCDAGYVASATSVTCNTDTFSATLTCDAITCAATSITNGVGTTAVTAYNEQHTFTCNAGYVISATAALTCDGTETNNWSAALPTCAAATCAAEPTTLTQGTFPAVPTGGYTGTVSITCNSGYKAGSTNSSLCTTTDTWDPTSVTCTAITCSALTVTNGAVAPTGTVAYDGVVTVSCNSGYTLSSTTGDLKCDGALSNNYNATTPTCTATTTVSTTAGSATLFHLHTALMAMLLSAFAFIKTL